MNHRDFLELLWGFFITIGEQRFTSRCLCFQLYMSYENGMSTEYGFIRCIYGGFLKYGYPCLSSNSRWDFPYKPSSIGYPHFRNPPYIYIIIYLYHYICHIWLVGFPSEHNSCSGECLLIVGYTGMLYGDTWSDFIEYNGIYNQQYDTYLSSYLSIHPSIHPSIHLSIYPSIYLSIYWCVWIWGPFSPDSCLGGTDDNPLGFWGTQFTYTHFRDAS